jgi:uncharacterized protein involved in exopolysaccharide biosynthesis
MTKNLADDLQRTARQALTALTPAPQGEEPGGLPFRRLLAAIFRARYLVFATTLFGLLIGSFSAITSANSYVSTGKFLFTSIGAESTMIDPARTTSTGSDAIGSGASHILNTDDLLKRVIKKLGPEQILQPYQPIAAEDSGARAWLYQVQRDWNDTKPEDRTEGVALRYLQGNLIVDHPRGSELLIATCTANNPALAQQILTTYMDEAITWHIEMWDDQRAYTEAERAATEARANRDVAARALREFLDRKAHVSQFDAEKERLERAQTAAAAQQLSLHQELASKKGALERLTRMLEVEKAIPKTKIEKRKPETTSNVQRGFEERLAATILKIVELEGKLRDPSDPQIVEMRKQQADITAAIAKVNKEAREAPEEEVEIENPEYAKAQEERLKLTTEVWATEAKLELADANVRDTRAGLKALLELEPEHERLHDAFATAEQTVAHTQANWSAAQQKRALGLGKFSSLKQIQSPTFPLQKQGPNRSKMVLSGLFVGLFLGFGIVLLRALPDSVVRTRDDLERIEGLPVIGIMPRLDGANLRRHVTLRERGW